MRMAATNLKPTVLLLDNGDTKLLELCYVQSHLLKTGVGVKPIDVGRQPISH